MLIYQRTLRAKFMTFNSLVKIHSRIYILVSNIFANAMGCISIERENFGTP